MSPEVQRLLIASGIDFAIPEDAAGAVLRIAADKSINGKLWIISLGEPVGCICLQEEDVLTVDWLFSFRPIPWDCFPKDVPNRVHRS